MRTPGQAWAAGAVATALVLGACGKKPPGGDPGSRAADVPAAVPMRADSAAGLYREHCATCHMDDGSGVPDMQPGLIGSPIIAGDRDRLEAVIRGGSAVLRDRPSAFGNEMPPFGFLTDAQVDALADYLRKQFGPQAP